jgi:hypothetical protein
MLTLRRTALPDRAPAPRYEPLSAEDAWAEFYAARAENAARLLAYMAALDARRVGL